MHQDVPSLGLGIKTQAPLSAWTAAETGNVSTAWQPGFFDFYGGSFLLDISEKPD